MKSRFSGSAADSATDLAAWPGAECCYRFAGTGPLPELAVIVSTRPDWLVPGPDDAPQAAVRQAGEHAGRYRLTGARLDAGSTVSLLSSLTGDLAMPVTEDVPALRRFTRAAELFAGAMAAATSPKLSGIATLDELLERYGLSPAQLAAANADRPLTGLLAAGQDLARRLGQGAPDTVPADASTLAEVAGRLRTSPGRLLAGNRGLMLATDPTAVLPGRITLPADARIAYPVRDGDTLAVLARRFATTPRELVAGNAEVAGTLLPGIRIEVPIASGSETALTGTDTLAGDSFAAVCDRLARQRADVSPEAVADALDRLGPVLAAGPVLSCPPAVLGSGSSTDPVTGASVRAEYGCSPQAFAAANAAVLGLLQPGVRLELDGASTTTTEHDTVHAVLDRLGGRGARPALDRLLAGADELPLFRAGARALLPPAAATLTVGLGPLDIAAPAVPLVVTLRLAGGTAAGAAERTDAPVPPSADREAFVDGCLAALPTLRLATDIHGALWAVSFGDEGIALVRIEPAAGGATEPQPFALRPLHPAPIGFTAVIRPVTERGELGEPVMRAYQSVDIEPWARSFLADLDGYLAEPLRSRLPDTARDRLVEFGRQLSGALAAGVGPVRSTESRPDTDAALARARTALAALARTGLSQAYGASVLAQYRAVVVSPYGSDGRPAARLLAAVREPDRSELAYSLGRLELDPSSATCTYGLACADPGSAAAVSVHPQQVFDALEVDPSGADSTEPVLLRFVRPLIDGYRIEGLATDLPPAELPVALREQPQPVPAEPMTATATFTGPQRPTLAEAVRWTAGLSYRHQHAAQDLVRISIRPRATPPTPHPGNTALAEALAGYLDAAARLTELIGADAATPDGSDVAAPATGASGGIEDSARPDTAAASLLTLVAAVTAAWQRHWTATPVLASLTPADTWKEPGRLEPGFSGEYRLRAIYSAGGQFDRLVVSRTATAGNWPDITLADQDGPLPLTPGPVLDNSREYTASGSLITSPLAVRLAWLGLRGAPGRSDRITVTAERNVQLLGRHPVDPEFVLAAQPVQVTVSSPSLRWKGEIPLPGTDLSQMLRDAFDVLAEGQPQHLCGFQVGYIERFEGLPVVRSALVGELILCAENAVQLATLMQDWQRKAQPATKGAVWQIRFTVPSARDGEPPLLTFDRLVLPVSAD